MFTEVCVGEALGHHTLLMVLCVTYSGSLRVSDVEDLVLSRHLQDVVYNSWEILQSQLIIAAAETGGQTGTLM